MIALLAKLKDRNVKKINPSKGRHYCDNCLSTGINPDSISIYEPCFSCGGHGHVTWIENATGDRRRDPNTETVEVCSLNNIVQTLIFLISSFRKLNVGHVSIAVNLDDVDKDDKKVKDLIKLLEAYDLL